MLKKVGRIMKKDILLTFGLSQREIRKDEKVMYQVSYCYQVMDMQSGETFQSAPAIAKERGYLKIKLAILIEMLTNYGPKFKKTKKNTYVHYAASDDRLKEIWHDVIFDGKKYNEDFQIDNENQWRTVIELCRENKIVLNISGRNSVLSVLSKAQGDMLRRQLEEEGG